MKTSNIIMLITILLAACTKGDHLRLESAVKPIAMNVYCQSSPHDIAWRIEYEYDHNNLVTETRLSNGAVRRKKSFEYDSDGRITEETLEFSNTKTKKSYIYNDFNQLIKVKRRSSEYDADGQLIRESESEDTFEYENNHLVKELQSWGGVITYEYKGGNLVKKTTFTKYGDAHHITTYEYEDEDGGEVDLLTVEHKETAQGNTMYHKTFFYDSWNRLVTVKDGDDIIEEYVYDEEDLVLKKEFYFGIDPCYSPCCGNYLYRYEY